MFLGRLKAEDCGLQRHGSVADVAKLYIVHVLCLYAGRIFFSGSRHTRILRLIELLSKYYTWSIFSCWPLGCGRSRNNFFLRALESEMLRNAQQYSEMLSNTQKCSAILRNAQECSAMLSNVHQCLAILAREISIHSRLRQFLIKCQAPETKLIQG